MSRIRVFVADDNDLVRYALRSLLDAEEDVSVVGEATDIEQAVTACREVTPDVVVLHAARGRSAEAVCRRIRDVCAQTAVLIISDSETDDDVVGAMHAGACGYLLDNAAPEHVVHAVRTLADGQSVFGHGVAEHLVTAQEHPSASHHELLSEREMEVLQLMAQGQSNKQIARSLWIGETTVKTHVSHILHKLGEADRTGAVLAGVKAGLVDLHQ